MVGINPKDRDMLRFFWYEDPFVSIPEPAVYRFNPRASCVSFQSTSFWFKTITIHSWATIEHHLHLFQQSDPEMAELLKDSLYVDDLITGEENNAKAFNVYKKSKFIYLVVMLKQHR